MSVSKPAAGTCRRCAMNPKFTHSANEHVVAEGLVEPLLEYVKTDAFSNADRPLTYGGALDRFRLPTSVRRVGRILDAVEHILVARGWPPAAAAGITAYVVNGTSGRPGDGWVEIWNMNPEDAREEARAHLRALILGPDTDD